MFILAICVESIQSYFLNKIYSFHFLEKEHVWPSWTQGVNTLLKMRQNKHLIFIKNALSLRLLIPWTLSEKAKKLG